MLSNSSLNSVSELVNLSGTKEKFSTPWLYNFLLFTLPAPFRAITNIHYHGLERIPKGAVILAANHISHVDPFVKIVAANRPVHYLAKQEHFNSKATKILMQSTGQIETSRENGGKNALSKAVDVLESGSSLGIFPEGTRSRNESSPFLQKGKTGVARLAAKFPNTPIVTMSINGSRDFMKPGSLIIKPWKRIDVFIGTPITFAEWITSPNGGNLDEEGIKTLLMKEEYEKIIEMKILFRKLTDQIMETLRINGAP
ncbi:MAG: lysophospholipid acyltransferase family protein [Candidatus Thalassarchaeaceae archaeon]|nr:lysophospholipid acyltransferase family protein [Candidatus Thalassarchaeaceae archaeon]